MTDDIKEERRANLEAAYQSLIKNVGVDELDKSSGTKWDDNDDWRGWVFDKTSISLEDDIEGRLLHGKIRRWIKDKRGRTVRRF